MKVNVAQLRRTEGASARFLFSETFPPLQLGNEEYFFQAPMEVQLDVTNTGKSLLVKGKLSSVINVNCSRCLKEFPFPLAFEFEDEWLPIEFSELDEEESAFIFEKDEFCIDECVMEHVLVHIPMKFMCSEDCKGLCPKCGADRNKESCVCAGADIDPRLEILSKWNKGV
ncbi:MAG: DUF177 domain-containing protein [Peptococcaceae bacterium]|nr:DUF177 domain-containing protein [Peptococcaceae bacterium]